MSGRFGRQGCYWGRGNRVERLIVLNVAVFLPPSLEEQGELSWLLTIPFWQKTHR